jgi:large subunit ribosomal protein L13
VDAVSYKTKSANKETTNKKWILVDAENEILGRLASRIAFVLRGKNKTEFTPHVDTGDNVIVINAEKIHLTGKKMDEKEYIRYTGYPGGQRFRTPKELLNTKPEEIIRYAVHGMLPKGPLGNQLRRNLFIYAGTNHPHEAQQPVQIKLTKTFKK